MKFLSNLILFLLIPTLCFGGVDFDGTDDSILIGDIPALDDSTEVSCSAWIKLKDIITGDHFIVGQRENATEADAGFELFFDDIGYTSGRTDTFQITIEESAAAGGGVVTIEGATNAGLLNTPQNIIFTADAENATGLRLYVDGIEDANSPADLSSINNLGNESNDFYIGARSNSSRFMKGIIFDLSCWSSILTTSEIQLLSSARIKRLPLQIQPNNLVFYFSLDDEPDGTSCDGDNFADLSGNGHNGTGDDGSNNTGLTAVAETVLSY